MNEHRARRYILSSNGNAFVAAWISVLDEHKLPLGTSVPPQEWYEAFEELYLSNAIDEVAFNTCNTKKVFFSGREVNGDELQRAFWNLQYLRSSSPGEAIDNEDPMSNDHPEDLFAIPQEEAPRNELELHRGDNRALSVPDHHSFGQLSAPPSSDFGLLDGPVIDRSNDLLAPYDNPNLPSNDIRGLPSADLPCRDDRKKGEPSTEDVNFSLTCCGEEVVLTDTGGGDWYEGEEDDDFDGVDLSMHGTCVRCASTFHLGAGIPMPKGSIGGLGYYG